MSKITWTPTKIRLGQIIPWTQNPRMSSKAQAQRLIRSERELGQVQTLAVSPFTEDGKVHLYDGHQRYSAWLTVKGVDFEIVAMQASRFLDDDERKKASIMLHTATGSWDWDALSSWSAADLMEWGLDGGTLRTWNIDAHNLKDMLESEKDGKEYYTKKVAAPTYKITGAKPKIEELYDDSYTRQLIANIDNAAISEDEKKFLRIAAQRHNRINFKLVAEYYAHASPETQRLMEDSALVIIDFNRAIELGYVRLSEEVIGQFEREYGDEGQ